jgi:hypothetical protein
MPYSMTLNCSDNVKEVKRKKKNPLTQSATRVAISVSSIFTKWPVSSLHFAREVASLRE